MIFIEQKRQLDGYVHFQTKRIIKLPCMRYHISPFPIQYVDSFSHWFRALWQATNQPRFPHESGCQNIQWLGFMAAVHPVNHAGCTDWQQHLATLIAVGNRSMSFLLEQTLAPKIIPAVTENYPTSIPIFPIKDLVNRNSLSESNSSKICLHLFAYISLEAAQLSTRFCLHSPIYPQKMKLTTHWHTLEVKDH